MRTNVIASGTQAAPVSSTGFSVGDIIFFYQTWGPGAGQYEFDQITAINSATSWTLLRPLAHTYDNTNGGAQVLRVPQYTNVMVETNSTLTAPAWDGNLGGLLVFRVQSLLQNDGHIDMGTYGFRGGALSCCGQIMHSGEGTAGPSLDTTGANGNGGGSGASSGFFANAKSGSGGGGGNGNAGSNGVSAGSIFGTGGLTAGAITLVTAPFGGGGGGGQCGGQGCGTGNGGNGGGLIFIAASTLSQSGTMLNSGGQGEDGDPTGNPYRSAAGGGGAGGSTLLRVNTATLGTNQVVADLGQGGNIVIGGSTIESGKGAPGRIRVEYCSDFAGTTNPPASTQQITCTP